MSGIVDFKVKTDPNIALEHCVDQTKMLLSIYRLGVFINVESYITLESARETSLLQTLISHFHTLSNTRVVQEVCGILISLFFFMGNCEVCFAFSQVEHIIFVHFSLRSGLML